MEYKNKKDLRKLLFQWQNHKNIKRQAERQSQHNRLQLVLSRREYWSTLQSKNYHNTDETCRFSTSNSKTQLGVSTSLLLCNVSARNAAGPCRGKKNFCVSRYLHFSVGTCEPPEILVQAMQVRQDHHRLYLEKASNISTPFPSQNCKRTHIQAHNGNTLHGSQWWLMYT